MRVISLLPAATEIVAYLGVTEHLVGITHECDFPPVIASRARVTSSALPPASASAGVIDAAVREATQAGTALFSLDHARIRALHPDVILTQALCDVCAVHEGDVRALAARLSPEPIIVTLGGTSIDGIMADIRSVASALGVPDEADELIAGDLARLRLVHDTLKAARAPRPRVLVIEWTDPLYVAGHWAPEQVHRAGGIDVLGVAGSHSVVFGADACEAANPEIVLIAPCGYGIDAAREEAERVCAEWGWLAGRQVWALDANGLVSRPGPRVVDGVEAMARIVFPAGFSAIDPRHAVRVQ
jgi:iron complex transport system substrate-binding protein